MISVVLIPVKNPVNAKTRLAGFLSAGERRRLAWAMFEDVTRAIAAARRPDRIVVVTSYGPAIAYAERLGWEALVEAGQTSESASVDWASRRLAEGGVDAVLRLPADLPLVQPEDIDGLLAVELRPPAALLVPSREGTGTNAIIRTPPALFPSRFGPHSLALHQEEAARVGVECAIFHNPRLALDIDEPADLETLLQSHAETNTLRLLAEMNVAERLRLLR